jgi:uncharacterized protein involved in outer membrane biogenesis
MRRTFFIILAAAGGLVALLLIAVAIVVWRVDPNDFVAPIQARIKQATGRDVEIRGGIDLKVSLTPKIVVHDLALANAAWGRAPQMMTTKQFELEVALLPLLDRRFEVIRIGLVEPSIALETDPQGHTNWDFGSAAAGAAPAQGVATLPAAFGVGNIAITNGTLTYRDGKSGAMTKVAIDSLELSARNAQSPVNAEFRGKVDHVAVALTGQLGPLDSLVQRRWPYPFALTGEIDGQKASIGAKLRAEGEAVHVEELEVAVGPNVVKGTVSVVTGGARPRYTINLTAPVLTLVQTATVLGAPAKLAAAGATGAGAARVHSTYLFSEAPLPLTPLRAIDASGELQIGRLVVSPTREFTAVQIRFTLHDGQLGVPLLKAATFGGSVDAHGSLDVPASGPPALALDVDARNLDLGAELAALDVRRDVKGGKTSVKADLHAHGASLHDFAASANGNVTVIAGPATIANAKLNPDSAFDRVAKATNPFREKDPTTELKCAVIRLPLAAGIAHIDRSVAAETQKLGVSVSGTLDLRNESIDITFKPRLREGIPIDVPQIAELVRLRGPLRNPQVTIDAMASVTTIARIGAGFSTGGLSEIGVALFGAVERGGAGPCAVALGAPAAKATTDNKAPAAAQGTESVSKALGKLLGR